MSDSTPELKEKIEEGENPEEASVEDSGSEEPEPSLEADLRSVRMMLRQTGRAHRREIYAEGSLWYLAAFGAVVLSALLAAFLVAGAVPLWTRGILWVGSGAVTLGALGTLVRFWQTGAGPESVARRLQQVETSFRNDIVAALEFGEQLTAEPEATDAELGFSRTLARAHLRRTVETMRERTAKHGHLGHLLPGRNLEPPLLALVGCMTLMLGGTLLAPELTARTIRSSFSIEAPSQQEEALVRPVVGDLQLEYQPPRYTGMGRSTEPHSTGHIETVVGTEVTISAYPLIEVDSVEMVLETGDGQRVVPLKPNGRGRLFKTLVLTDSGSYHFRATLPDGTKVTDGMDRQIDLTPDAAPEVTITSHDGEVEVSPEDVLEVEFAVEDDYGIDSVTRIHHFAGSSGDKKSKPLQLASLNETPEQVGGSVTVDLRSMSLKPKDVVVLYLRSADNNSLTGPGVGKSQPLMLRVSSPEDKHMKNVEAQRKISQKLLGVLADYLETPVGERKRQEDGTYQQVVDNEAGPAELGTTIQQLARVHGREAEVLDRMKKLVDRMKDDPLMVKRDRTLFAGLHEHLRELHRRGERVFGRLRQGGKLPATIRPAKASRAADFAADMEDSLEKGVLQILELVASQKMDAVKATREDIRKAKDRLKELLEKYKKSKDPELKKAIKREINRLRQRMAEMMSRMQMQIRKLPDEHINSEALKRQQLESDTRKMTDHLKSMEQMLEKGDIDGAMKALEQMEQNLSSLGEEMDQQFARAQPKGLSKLDKEVSELMNGVNDLQSAEKKLEEETRKIQKERDRKRQKQIDEMLDKFTDRMKKQVDRQLKSMDEMGGDKLPSHEQSELQKNRQKLEELDKMLEQKDIKGALEKARESNDKLRTMRFNLELSQRHARSDSRQARRVDKALEEAEQMIPRGQRIEGELERMMQKAQKKLNRPGSRQMKELAERQKRIAERAEKLNEQIEKSSKDFPMLKKQLKPSLDQAKEEMGKAEKRLGKGESQGALDSERSALEQLGKLKQAMRQTMQKQRSKGKGGRGQRKKKVKIPGQQDGESRQELRGEVMDAMKEEKLQKYEKEIQRYYKSLVE